MNVETDAKQRNNREMQKQSSTIFDRVELFEQEAGASKTSSSTEKFKLNNLHSPQQKTLTSIYVKFKNTKKQKNSPLSIFLAICITLPAKCNICTHAPSNKHAYRNEPTQQTKHYPRVHKSLMLPSMTIPRVNAVTIYCTSLVVGQQ